jgi:hypothetical protein
VSIQKKIDFAAIFNSLEPGDELLWLDTYAPDEMGWIENLERAVSRGAAVKMLVLNPNSKLVQLRAEEIVSSHFSPEKFREGLTKFYQDMLHCQEEGQGRMEVRVYDDLLGCPVYLIARNGQARKAISSLYLSTATYAFPHFVWEASAERQILDALENYFRKKWSKASGADGTRVSG